MLWSGTSSSSFKFYVIRCWHSKNKNWLINDGRDLINHITWRQRGPPTFPVEYIRDNIRYCWRTCVVLDIYLSIELGQQYTLCHSAPNSGHYLSLCYDALTLPIRHVHCVITWGLLYIIMQRIIKGDCGLSRTGECGCHYFSAFKKTQWCRVIALLLLASVVSVTLIPKDEQGDHLGLLKSLNYCTLGWTQFVGSKSTSAYLNQYNTVLSFEY